MKDKITGLFALDVYFKRKTISLRWLAMFILA